MFIRKVKENADNNIDENNTKDNYPQINIQRFPVLSDFTVIPASQSTFLRVTFFIFSAGASSCFRWCLPAATIRLKKPRKASEAFILYFKEIQ